MGVADLRPEAPLEAGGLDLRLAAVARVLDLELSRSLAEQRRLGQQRGGAARDLEPHLQRDRAPLELLGHRRAVRLRQRQARGQQRAQRGACAGDGERQPAAVLAAHHREQHQAEARRDLARAGRVHDEVGAGCDQRGDRQPAAPLVELRQQRGGRRGGHCDPLGRDVEVAERGHRLALDAVAAELGDAQALQQAEPRRREQHRSDRGRRCSRPAVGARARHHQQRGPVGDPVGRLPRLERPGRGLVVERRLGEHLDERAQHHRGHEQPADRQAADAAEPPRRAQQRACQQQQQAATHLLEVDPERVERQHQQAEAHPRQPARERRPVGVGLVHAWRLWSNRRIAST